MKPFIDRINAIRFIRVKANLTTMTNEIVKYGWHVDTKECPYKYRTAVYYVNSNNGKTIFKNGQEIDSVANRMVIFDGDLVHTGTSCTDEKVRCVINFNWI